MITSSARAIASVTLILALLPRSGSAQGIVFPKDAGVLNVKNFGAKGDGRTDDTLAIQKVFADHPNEGRIIYLPNGTYLISDTLRWPHGDDEASSETNTILQGQSREKTIIRLKDDCPDFQDPKSPRAMIWTGRAPAQRYRNAVRDLTIDTGKQNAGAIGLQFMANGQGCVRDVTIRSSDGLARVGLDMTFCPDIGPLLVKNVRVVGFDFGIRTAHGTNSMTFEHISLENQNRFGFVNEGQCVSIRDLSSKSAASAIINAEGPGLLALVDAKLDGVRVASSKPAIVNEAAMFARNVSTSAYRESIRNTSGGRQPDGRKVAQFVSHPILSLHSSPPRSLNLPVKETPDVAWDPIKDWASPTQFGAVANDNRDDSKAIQAAIDSGKTTVYFPCGSYQISETIVVRKNVRRLIGCEAKLEIRELKGASAFKIAEGMSPTVLFERFWCDAGQTPTLDNASKRTLVVKDCYNISGRMTGLGEIFLEDVCSSSAAGWQFASQNIWARQLSVRNEGPHILNSAGNLWILGLMTEAGGTLVETHQGGRTEILGGLASAATSGKLGPMFIAQDASLSVVLGEASSTVEAAEILVRETRGNVAKTLKRGDAPARAGGSLMPLFTGYSR
jgi:hypothetical protein